MTDIVQTLRNLADGAELQQAPYSYVLHLRAGAGEIERLRAAMQEIIDFDTDEDITNEECMRDIARAALEWK